MEHGKGEGAKMGLGRSLALPGIRMGPTDGLYSEGRVLRVPILIHPCFIRVSSVAKVGHRVLRTVSIRRGVAGEGLSKCITVIHLILAGSVPRSPTDGHIGNAHGTGAKMELSGSFALPVLRTVTVRGSRRAVTLPCSIRVSSVAHGNALLHFAAAVVPAVGFRAFG